MANFLPSPQTSVDDPRTGKIANEWYRYFNTLSTGSSGGSVQAVTASSPLSSSGGITPNISLTGVVGITHGGTGTASPSLLAGTNVTITGSWPDQTINADGSVSSVGLSLPSLFSVTGSPVTSAGTLTATLVTQAPNLVFAGPSSGPNAIPTFRALAPADLPTENVRTVTTTATVALLDSLIVLTPVATPFTVTLPGVVAATGRTYTFYYSPNATTAISISSAPGDGAIINGSTIYNLRIRYQTVTFTSNGTTWEVMDSRAAYGGLNSIQYNNLNYLDATTATYNASTGVYVFPAFSITAANAGQPAPFMTMTGALKCLASNQTSGAQNLSGSLGNSQFYQANCAAGNVTYTLPNAGANNGIWYTFIKIDSSANTATINPLTGAQTINGAASVVLTQQYQSITIFADSASSTWKIVGQSSGSSTPAPPVNGQCRLTKSGSNLLLSRFNGQYITINGVQQSIPSAGVTLAATGTTPLTLYYIYAYMSGTTMTLEASTTTHATDATTGVEIKSGDPTRTLVGMARPITGPAWQDTTSQRFVISWFNRRAIVGFSQLSANVNVISATLVEVSTSLRAEYLLWAGGAINSSLTGVWYATTTPVSAFVSIGFNGVSSTGALTATNFQSVGVVQLCNTSAYRGGSGVVDGYGYATVGARTNATDGVTFSATSVNTELQIAIEG